MSGDGMKINEKERAFVAAFMGPARGNGSKAAIMAGYAPKSARVTASRLLTKANIQRALVARQNRATSRSIATADERDRVLSEILRSEKDRDPFVAIRAVSELNKCEGRHSSTINHKGKLTLEAVLTESMGKA